MESNLFKGRLVGVDGKPLSHHNLIIERIDSNPLVMNQKIAETATNSEGNFHVSSRELAEKQKNQNSPAKIKLEVGFKGEKLYETVLTVNLKGKTIDFGLVKVKGPNRGVKGKVLDEKGDPLEGLVVSVEGAGKTEYSLKRSPAVEIIDKISPVAIKNYHVLNESKTDENGFYEVLYPPSSYQNILDDKPTIQVVIKDVLGASELFKTEQYTAVSETMKNIEDIIIPRNWASGWYVTLGNSEKSRFTENNQVEVLVDNQSELESVVQSINSAHSYVYLTQFEFEPDFTATFTSETDGTFHTQDILTQTLLNASSRGIQVKIILNENLAVPDSYKEIKDFFKESSVEIRQFKSHGLHVMHAKTLIVDDKEAYIIGSPFKKDYWDSSRHLINDPRREPNGVRPVHDVSVKLKGGAVYHVQEFFTQMWNYISREDYNGHGRMDQHLKTRGSGKTPVQVARSVTPETLTDKGELGIFEGYRKALANAKDYIYLENQFFTNKTIVKALKNTLKNNDDIQVIVLMNENPDNPGYKKWQNQCIEKMGIKTYEDILEHPQIGFFTLWSTGWEKQRFQIQPVYVHAKVGVVDDLWATVGTANLDGSSLTYVNELEGFFDTKFHRNMEINVILPGLDKDSSNYIGKLRNSLWTEHLGIKGSSSLEKPREGWLKIWQEVAEQNLKSLNLPKPFITGHVLPYSPENSVEDQLKDLKIEIRDWDVLD